MKAPEQCVNDVSLVSLLLALIRSCTLIWRFYGWEWTSKCQLGFDYIPKWLTIYRTASSHLFKIIFVSIFVEIVQKFLAFLKVLIKSNNSLPIMNCQKCLHKFEIYTDLIILPFSKQPKWKCSHSELFFTQRSRGSWVQGSIPITLSCLKMSLKHYWWKFSFDRGVHLRFQVENIFTYLITLTT